MHHPDKNLKRKHDATEEFKTLQAAFETIKEDRDAKTEEAKRAEQAKKQAEQAKQADEQAKRANAERAERAWAETVRAKRVWAETVRAKHPTGAGRTRRGTSVNPIKITRPHQTQSWPRTPRPKPTTDIPDKTTPPIMTLDFQSALERFPKAPRAIKHPGMRDEDYLGDMKKCMDDWFPFTGTMVALLKDCLEQTRGIWFESGRGEPTDAPAAERRFDIYRRHLVVTKAILYWWLGAIESQMRCLNRLARRKSAPECKGS